MLERHMEDLIAAHPKDFLGKEFSLIGRQQSFAGVGRFDLLFKDEFETNILMELKARVAKYEDATQLAKYKDELQRRGTTAILMWLVAPHIPPSVREFLDRIGIEYTEIHEAQFRRVAERYSHFLIETADAGETHPERSASADVRSAPRQVGSFALGAAIIRRTYNPSQVFTGPTVSTPPKFQWKATALDLSLANPQDFDRKRFEELVACFESSVKSKKNRSVVDELRIWASDPLHGQIAQKTYFSLLRWVTTSGWKYAVPHAEALWVYLFGSPAPTWYSWNQNERRYKFDQDGWRRWFDSLRSTLRATEAIYKEHNTESARGWPAKDQCQCQDCQNYRAGHPSVSSL